MSEGEPVLEQVQETVAPEGLIDSGEAVMELTGEWETGPLYFLSFAASALMVWTALVWLLLLFAVQRLAGPPWLLRTVLTSAWGVLSTVDTVFLLVGLTVLTGKNFVPFFKGRHIALTGIIPWAVRACQLVGLSKDRMTHSILQVGNALTRVNLKDIARDELLILLPRSLHPRTRDEIKRVTAKYNVEFHICSDSQTTRQLLQEKKPQGVIAVGCEHDLLAGVQDANVPVPVILLVGKRAQEPHIKTSINLIELENAIRLYLGKLPLPVKTRPR